MCGTSGFRVIVQTAPPTDSTFNLCNTNLRLFQFYRICSMAEMWSSIDEIKVFFGTLSFFISHGPLQFHVKLSGIFFRNFIENKAFLPWNIFNETETAVRVDLFVLQKFSTRINMILKIELGGGAVCRSAPIAVKPEVPYIITSCRQNQNSNRREDRNTPRIGLKHSVSFNIFIIQTV